MKYNLITFFLLLVIFAKAQSNDSLSMFEWRVDALSFFKNNEYESQSGYTLIGYRLDPEFRFNANQKYSLGLKVDALQYFGKNKYNIFYPYFNMRYIPNPNLQINLGYLDDNLDHGFCEPLFDSENFLKDSIENGFQIKYKSERIKSDLFLNWHNFILWGDDDKERFLVGNVSSFKIIKEQNLYFTLEFLISHRGGEIDSCKESMQSLANASFGLYYNKDLSTNTALKIEAKMLGTKVMHGDGNEPYQKGNAFYSMANLNYKSWNFGLGYYKGHHFFSIKGYDIFSSNHNQIIGELFYQKNYHDFFFGVGAKTYYDTNAQKLDYYYMIDMHYNAIFWSKKKIKNFNFKAEI